MGKSFVFIFRQGSRKLTEEEQKRRREEVRAWALQHIKNGSHLDPRILGEESRSRLGDGTAQANTDAPVIALNFVEATNLEQAVEMGKTHPGIRYGVEIEVRSWSDPRTNSAPLKPA